MRFSDIPPKVTGFRSIEIKGYLFLVNGVPIKLKGVNRHETDPTMATPLPRSRWFAISCSLNKLIATTYVPATTLMTRVGMCFATNMVFTCGRG